jgi:hypothetical protein
MFCANSACRAIAEDLLKGTLMLVEFETSPDERLQHAAGGFPVCSARTKYFWLCPVCSRRFAIRKWNASGLFVEPIYTDSLSVRQTGDGRKQTPAVKPVEDRLSRIA